jgi:hypothetical protein
MVPKNSAKWLIFSEAYARRLISWPHIRLSVALDRFRRRHTTGSQTATRLSTSPVIGVLESTWDFGSSAVEARILRPLVWFGLLQSRTEGSSPTESIERRLHRKAPLFDRFLKFNVPVESPDTSFSERRPRTNGGTAQDQQSRTGHHRPVLLFISVAFIARDDSVTLDSDLGI